MSATVKRTLIVQSTNVSTGELVQRNFANANPSATAANIDTFARAINGLSTNTYSDTLIVDTSSTNEILAE